MSFLEVFGHSFGIEGASGAVVIAIPLVFANAGNGTWLAFVMAVAGYLLVAAQINVFTQNISTPGSLFTYARYGLGPFAATITGWSLVIAYFLCIPLNMGAVAYFIIIFIREITGMGSGQDMMLPLAITSVAVLALAWWFCHRDVKLSTRTTLGLEAMTLLFVFLIFGGYIWHHGITLDHPQANLSGVTFEQFRLGLVLAMFTFTGFEASAVLGIEAKLPFKMIPRAVVATIVIDGLIVAVCSYFLVQAFQGADPALDKAEAPLSTLAQVSGLGFAGPFVSAGIAVSWFGCLLGVLNTAGRLLYALAHRGLFHKSASQTHYHHATPHIALALLAGLGLVLSLALTFSGVGAMDGVNYLGSTATFGFLFAYIIIAIAAPCYLHRQGKLRPKHIVSAILAVIMMLIPLVGNLYPIPDWPYNILPFVFLVPLLLGLGYFLYIRKTDPDRLAIVEADLEAQHMG